MPESARALSEHLARPAAASGTCARAITLLFVAGEPEPTYAIRRFAARPALSGTGVAGREVLKPPAPRAPLPRSIARRPQHPHVWRSWRVARFRAPRCLACVGVEGAGSALVGASPRFAAALRGSSACALTPKWPSAPPVILHAFTRGLGFSRLPALAGRRRPALDHRPRGDALRRGACRSTLVRCCVPRRCFKCRRVLPSQLVVVSAARPAAPCAAAPSHQR